MPFCPRQNQTDRGGTHVPDTSSFRDTLQGIIADPATSDALRPYAVSATNRDPVDVLAELTFLKSVFDNEVDTLLHNTTRSSV